MDINHVLREKLQPNIQMIVKKYSYVSIPSEVQDFIVKDILDEFMNGSGGLNESFNQYFLEKLDQYFRGYIKEQLENYQGQEILNQYIESNIKEEKGINELGKLFHLFRQIGYDVDIGFYSDIIESNDILNGIVLEFLEKNLKKIQDGFLSTLVDDDTVLLIESYCIQHGIEIDSREIKAVDNIIDELEKKAQSFINETEKNEDEENLNSGLADQDFFVEVDLLKQYLKEVGEKGKKKLTKEEERELSIRIKNGDLEARKKLAESNLKLVVSIAKGYQNRGLSFLDVIQDGNEGLMKAVDKFDPNKGKFSTCATPWIRQSILYAIYYTGKTVRLPVNVIEQIRKLSIAETKLEEKLGRTPNRKEIAKKLKKSQAYVDDLYLLKQNVDSLDREVVNNQGGVCSLSDSISDLEQDTEKKGILHQLNLELRQLMESANLKDTQKEALILRYGLDNNISMTLEEVARIKNVSIETIRQREAKGLKKIRNLNKTKAFSIYLDYPKEAEKNLEILKKQSKKKLDGQSRKKDSKKKRRVNQQIASVLKEVKEVKDMINPSICVFEHYMPLEINYGSYEISPNYHEQAVQKKKK